MSSRFVGDVPWGQRRGASGGRLQRGSGAPAAARWSALAAARWGALRANWCSAAGLALCVFGVSACGSRAAPERFETREPAPEVAAAGATAAAPAVPVPTLTLGGSVAAPRREVLALSTPAREALRRSVSTGLSRSLEGVEERTLSNLGRAADVRDRFQHVVVQVRDEQGNFHTECLESQQQLDDLLGTGPTP